MRSVLRVVVLFLVLASLSVCETLDEAARNLAKRASARLGGADVARVRARNLSSLDDSDVEKARAGFERALARRPSAQIGDSVDIGFVVSENRRGLLLIAEWQRTDGPDSKVVEMVEYRPAQPARAARSLTLARRLVWEQPNPILDIAVVEETMIVLEPLALTTFFSRGSKWDRAEERTLEAVAPVRDARGRLSVNNDGVTAVLPGYVCRGTWRPKLEIACRPGDGEFALGGESVKFSKGRNTLESGGWRPFYSIVRFEEEARPLFLVSETDGHGRLYDVNRKPLGIVDAVGSDLVMLETPGCAPIIVASGSGVDEESDSLTPYEISKGKLARAGASLDFGGRITGLWRSADGATAVVRNAMTGRYAAYSITMDCGV